MATWVLLTYKLPTEPSARRVYVWRKLKRLGAVTVFEAVWVLPSTPRNVEQFQWLAAEIQEMGGEAMYWHATLAEGIHEEALIAMFTRQVEAAYHELSLKLDQPDPEYAGLGREYQQIHQKDYFQSELGRQVLQKLSAARGDLP